MKEINQKKVVLIGGTGRSGSTMLDLMLGNASDAFSCGELYALFRPQKRSELHFQCNCKNPNCCIWNAIRNYSEAEAYKALFENIPGIQFIIDSSKSLPWIKDQIRYNRNSFIELKHILIWKDPLNFAYSRWKRGVIRGWRRAWVNYHRGYFSIVPFFRSIKLEDLISSPSYKLKSLCQYLQMDYFPGKEFYWTKEHHIIFGSRSAIGLLHRKGEKKIFPLIKDIKFKKIETRLREIIYKDSTIQKILYVLEATDINKPILSPKELNNLVNPLKISILWVYFERIRQYFKSLTLRLYEKRETHHLYNI